MGLSRAARSGQLFLTLLLLLPGATLGTRAPLAAEGPGESTVRVPAAGRHEIIFSIPTFGRYAISVHSEQGCSLQSISRMTGPGELSGIPGKEDGRLDLFLDHGEIKIITLGVEKASGEAEVRIRSFEEINESPLQQLIALKPIETELRDGEQRSWWINMEYEGWINIEAGGRALRDLRLWKEGSWLIDALPEAEETTPHPGQPIQVLRQALHLDAGLYLLTAYGGKATPWSEESDAWTLFLRMDTPRLGTAGRLRHKIGELGIDRYLLPGEVDFVQVEEPEARPLELSTAYWEESHPFPAAQRRSHIQKNSRTPSAKIHIPGTPARTDTLVTIRGQAGTPYVLQYFRSSQNLWFHRSVDSWISTISTGPPGDSLEITGILSRRPRRRIGNNEAVRDQCIELGRSAGYSTRCNLLGRLTVFLKVIEKGRYRIDSTGVEAQFRVEPFFINLPENYKTPKWKNGGGSWDLDAGYYILSIRPVEKGILEMAISSPSLLENLLKMAGLKKEREKAFPRLSLRFGVTRMDSNYDFTLSINQRPDVLSGVVLRRSPVDITDPLPLALRPEEEITVPVHLDEPSRIEVICEDGTLIPFSLDGRPDADRADTASGNHHIVLKSSCSQSRWCSLSATPQRLLAETKLPPLPEHLRESLPYFPELPIGLPTFFDIGPDNRLVYLVDLPEDSLYRIESGGLLNTEATLRSRTQINIATSSDGGPGRNFRIGEYLGAGIYQLSLRGIGNSYGHGSLSLHSSRPRKGGVLSPGIPARASLGADEAIEYSIPITRAGRYHIRSFGLLSSARCRLEDEDGWPILPPGGPAEINRHLDAGNYRLVILPEATPMQRLSLIEVIPPDPGSPDGHGPHQLDFDRTYHALWKEPEAGEERIPDSWTFSLEGKTKLNISLSRGMGARLVRVGDEAETVGKLGEQAEIPAEIEAGAYRLEVFSLRPDNQLPYTLRIIPRALLPGMQREITAPAKIEISTRGGLLDISSFGRADVRARLLDAQGRFLAASDDRPDDWNFLISERLGAGSYVLKVDPVGSAKADSSIRVLRRREKELEAADLPLSRRIDLEREVLILPLPPSVEGETLLLSAHSAAAFGLEVEEEGSKGWESTAHRSGRRGLVIIPRTPKAALRLRLWSLDGQPLHLDLQARNFVPQEISEFDLSRAYGLEAIPDFEPPMILAHLRLDRPGSLQSGIPDILWSAMIGRELKSVEDGRISSLSRDGWLAVPRKILELRAKRIRLPAEGMRLSMKGGSSIPIDLSPGSGLRIFSANCVSGAPSLRLQRLSGGKKEPPEGHWNSSHEAMAAIIDRRDAGLLVSLSGKADHGDVRIREYSLKIPRAGSRLHRFEEGRLGSEALVFSLPESLSLLRLNLPAGVAALLESGGRIRRIIPTGASAVSENLEASGGRLILAPLDGGGAFSIRLSHLEHSRYIIPAEGPKALQMMDHGAFSLRVQAKDQPERVLRIYGAVSASFSSDGGELFEGERLPIGPEGGILKIRYQPGLLLMWSGKKTDPDQGLFAAFDEPKPLSSTLPLSVDAADASSLAIDAGDHKPFNLRCTGAVAFRLRMEKEQSRVWIQAAGSRTLFIPGRGRLDILPLDPPARVTLEAIQVDEASEGLGREILLAPGEAHGARFFIPERRTIGVGVRSDPDAATVELFDDAGKCLDRGLILMHELEAGQYILIIRAGLDADTPLRLRPALVGIKGPPSGPPAELIHSYIEEGERKR